jgi:4-diphosphocytidyl-2-C-methyl-D-erythritol kinase
MLLRAYGKINLGLRIVGERRDGFHNIETVFHRINLYDGISFEQSSAVSLTCNYPAIPTDERNLCLRAAKVLQEDNSESNTKGVRIVLTKKIPVGSGLGGGSSDAAVTLLALTRFWNLKTSPDTIHAFAEEVGSDVPYFLKPGSAYAVARGNVLDYFHLDIPYWIAVISPNVSVSTSWAYANVQRVDHLPRIPLAYFVKEYITHPEVLRQYVHNDFEPLVSEAYPEVARAQQLLQDAGAVFTQLSGTGSAVFGFFTDELHAQQVTKKIPEHFKVFLTPPHFQANEQDSQK